MYAGWSITGDVASKHLTMPIFFICFRERGSNFIKNFGETTSTFSIRAPILIFIALYQKQQ
jgi:hypothetical protein